MSKSWRTPREGPKKNVRPSGPHKQKDRNKFDDDMDGYGDNSLTYNFDYNWIDTGDDSLWDGNQPKHPKP